MFSFHTLGLQRARGGAFQVARILGFISNTARLLGLHEEGTKKAREALEMHKRPNHVPTQARSLQRLASLLYEDNRLDAVEEAASQVSRTRATKVFSAIFTASSVLFAVQEERQNRPSPTSRQPSAPRPLPTGVVTCLGIVIPWHSCFPAKTGSMTHTSTSTASSRTRPVTRTGYW